MFVKSYTPNSNVMGIILMIVHAIMMSSLLVIGKKLTQITNPEQITALYKFGIVIAILPWCSRKGGLIQNLATKKIGLHVMRGIFSALASISFYYGLRTINIWDATALTFLEQAIVLFIGIFYFKEVISFGKVIMILSGVIGGLLVTKPGFGKFDIGYIYVFLALLFWAGNNVSIKALGKTEKNKTQVFYSAFFGCLVSFLIVLGKGEWVEFKISYLKYVVVLALLYFIHTLAFFKAFKFSDMSLVIPFDYTRIIFTGLIGYIVLSEVPDRWSLLGYGVIVLGGIYLIVEEGRKGWHKETEKQFKNDMTAT